MLEWPRLSVFDRDGFLLSGTDAVPRQLLNAVTEYAVALVRHQMKEVNNAD